MTHNERAQYEIVFRGETVPGADLERVKSNLAKLFQADEQRITLLFSGRRLVLKNNLDSDSAEKYRSTLERAGAVAEVVEMAVEIEEIEMTALPGEPMPEPRSTASSVIPRDAYMAAFINVEAPDYPIAAVGSDLQDQRPAAVAPVFDFTAISVAPAGSDMGQLKAAPADVVPDTSHLKLQPVG